MERCSHRKRSERAPPSLSTLSLPPSLSKPSLLALPADPSLSLPPDPFLSPLFLPPLSPRSFSHLVWVGQGVIPRVHQQGGDGGRREAGTEGAGRGRARAGLRKARGVEDRRGGRIREGAGGGRGRCERPGCLPHLLPLGLEALEEEEVERPGPNLRGRPPDLRREARLGAGWPRGGGGGGGGGGEGIGGLRGQQLYPSLAREVDWTRVEDLAAEAGLGQRVSRGPGLLC